MGWIQIMACSGNQRARVFFKQHGWTDEGGMKLEGKYTSRAAEMYKQTLIREVRSLSTPPLNTASTERATPQPPTRLSISTAPSGRLVQRRATFNRRRIPNVQRTE